MARGTRSTQLQSSLKWMALPLETRQQILQHALRLRLPETDPPAKLTTNSVPTSKSRQHLLQTLEAGKPDQDAIKDFKDSLQSLTEVFKHQLRFPLERLLKGLKSLRVETKDALFSGYNVAVLIVHCLQNGPMNEVIEVAQANLDDHYEKVQDHIRESKTLREIDPPSSEGNATTRSKCSSRPSIAD